MEACIFFLGASDAPTDNGLLTWKNLLGNMRIVQNPSWRRLNPGANRGKGSGSVVENPGFQEEGFSRLNHKGSGEEGQQFQSGFQEQRG